MKILKRKRHSLIAENTGFTLLEVLVALAILGGALFVLLDSHYTSLRLHDQMRQEVEMRQFFESALAKAKMEVMLGKLSGGGDFGRRYPDVAWSYQATRSGGEESLTELYDVQVTVKDINNEKSMEFHVYKTGVETQSSGNIFNR